MWYNPDYNTVIVNKNGITYLRISSNVYEQYIYITWINLHESEIYQK